MSTPAPPTALVILDGFGYRKDPSYNAIQHAKTPHFTSWMKEYPHAILQASGTSVGLPKGTIGNSEAGHITIGLGRIIKESNTIITDAINDKSFFSHPTLINSLRKIKPGHTLHLMGLISDAGVHADLKHLYAFLKAAKQQGITNVVVHAFLDGRDTPPQSAVRYLQQLEDMFHELKIGKIGSIHGRFYAMDRDNNWQRTEQSYRILTEPQKEIPSDWKHLLTTYYNQHIFDEFIPPIQLDPDATIKPGDGIIFFNFRPDRARQLTASFVDPAFKKFPVKNIPLVFFITPVPYDATLKTNYLYEQPLGHCTHSLKDVLLAHHKTIFVIAETEKYAHVTYFFSGGKEETYPNETRVLIPSIKTKNYVQQPEMSAELITQRIVESLNTAPRDFYLINYANADMVGHSGNFGATIKAVEYLDKQIGILYQEIVEKRNGTLYITADHGNAEDMYDEKTNQPRTSHTTNPVPFIMIRQDLKNKPEKLPLSGLSDIAPFILKNMRLPIPKEMKR